MALSAAERQRRRRQRIQEDQERRDLERQKERLRWHKRVESGKIKKVSNLTEREKRKQRKMWRKYKAEKKNKSKMMQNVVTPPTTPEYQPDQRSRQSVAGKRKAQKNKREIRKRLYELESRLEKEKKKSDKYRKRWERTKPLTPKRKTMKLLRESYGTLRSKLLFHVVLTEEIRLKFLKAKTERLRNIYARLIAGKVLKKYKLIKFVNTELGIGPKRLMTAMKKPLQTLAKRQWFSKRYRLQTLVKEFYCRDDVSRMLSGKKETITHKKVKRQRRILLESLVALHSRYSAEYPQNPLSYSLFCKMRPFNVTKPSMKDRNTCMCMTHENMQMLVTKLKMLNILKSSDVSALVSEVVCDPTRKVCMYEECETCQSNAIPITEGIDTTSSTSWVMWKTVKETREINKETRQVTITKKVQKDGSIDDLIDSTTQLLTKFKRHHFNMRHQHSFYRDLRENLAENECLLHVDYSENYQGKSSHEVQSAHFGASHRQVTLHTGVYYIGTNTQKTFCTVSDSTIHGPSAVWLHLKPILKEIREKFPHVDVLNIFSDGPTTQYKQKGNFFLLANMPYLYGFKSATWNFHESSHGKGVPDGIGATIKRLADAAVLHGRDIETASDLMKHVKTSIQMYEIGEAEIIQGTEDLSSYKLTSIPSTMRLHQVVTTVKNTVQSRVLGCHCPQLPTPCQCFNPTSHQFHGSRINENFWNPFNPSNVSRTASDDRRVYFSQCLKRLNTCTTYERLKELACSLEEEVSRYNIPQQSSIVLSDRQIDRAAQALIPDDCDPNLIPIQVPGDGDCLLHAASYLAYGQIGNTDEVRTRIIIELAVHDDLYLDPEYLRRGTLISDRQAKCIASNFAMYSDKYDPSSQKLDSATVKMIFQAELMSITKPFIYMGIWQLMALASVLGVQVKSVYPNLGNPNVRSDLNRTILPRLGGEHTLSLMWTSTRYRDMSKEHFVPNHFVPLSRRDKTDTASQYLGKHVVVKYEEVCYPGLVVNEDADDVECRCMHRIGNNRFYWPTIEDVCWYTKDRVMAVIPEPTPVTGRHMQVDPLLWKEIIDRASLKC